MELFEKYKDEKGSQATLKRPDQLQELLDVTRSLLKEMTEAAQQLPQVAETMNDAKSESKSETSDSARDKADVPISIFSVLESFCGSRNIEKSLESL